MLDKRVKGCLLVIGNEVLEGRTQDTHTKWFADQLSEQGIWLDEVRIIPDDKDRIAAAVRECKEKFSHVFTTGGLGPTVDDITTESVAAAFDPPLVLIKDAATDAKLIAYYAKTHREYNADRKKMALVPEGAVVIPNIEGVAPGFALNNVYVFPGIPKETKAMFDSIKGKLVGGPKPVSKSIFVIAAEGDINTGLRAVKKACPDVIIGSYPNNNPATGRMITEIKFRHTDAALVEAAHTEMMKFITENGLKLTEKPPVEELQQVRGI